MYARRHPVQCHRVRQGGRRRLRAVPGSAPSPRERIVCTQRTPNGLVPPAPDPCHFAAQPSCGHPPLAHMPRARSRIRRAHTLPCLCCLTHPLAYAGAAEAEPGEGGRRAQEARVPRQQGAPPLPPTPPSAALSCAQFPLPPPPPPAASMYRTQFSRDAGGACIPTRFTRNPPFAHRRTVAVCDATAVAAATAGRQIEQPRMRKQLGQLKISLSSVRPSTRARTHPIHLMKSIALPENTFNIPSPLRFLFHPPPPDLILAAPAVRSLVLTSAAAAGCAQSDGTGEVAAILQQMLQVRGGPVGGGRGGAG
jgi:hypothetical protein